jgi:hypothetical protein
VTADVVYPASEVTPHGWWHIVNDTRPMMRLRAYDGSIDFHLMGGLAPPYHDTFAAPESVALTDLKGLIPPWKHIVQKGATQDGVTHIDALYDPCEVQATVECVGRDQVHLRRVVRDLIASLDAKQQSELSWLTQDLGYWWAPVRWLNGAPPDPLNNQGVNRQRLSLRLSADDAFWRSYDDTSMFAFDYEDMTETFATDYSTPHTLGPNWPQYYTGAGGGYCEARDGQARWLDDPGDPFTTSAREVVNGPYKDFATAGDNQVISVVLGSIPEITLGDGAYADIWARMSRDGGGAWTGHGIRCRIGMYNTVPWIKLSRFVAFTETILTERPLLLMPLMGEKFTLVCGVEGKPRYFQLLRNGIQIMVHQESGTGSSMGASYRGIGFGMRAGAALISQATPPNVRKISSGDNATVSQSGFNVGDQPMYRDYTVFGPGLFRIYDGPGASDYVEFGPLLPNQIAFLRTDPRSKTPLVQDLTSTPPTPQELNVFQEALRKFLDFASDQNALITQIESAFGIAPPQGPMYSLLSGRFSDNSAIPPKSPGRPAQPYYVKCEIDDGNADSKIISSGTPLRRYPI